MHTFSFIFVATVWSFSFVLMGWSGAAFGPLGIAGFRSLGGALVLLPLLPFLRGRRAVLRDWWGLGVLLFFSYAWPYTVQPVMVRELGSGFTAIMISLVPIMTILVSVPLLGVRATRRQTLGVVAGFLGMIVLFGDKLHRHAAPGALLLAGTVPIAYAIGNTWNKKRFSGRSPIVVACISMLAGGSLLTTASLAIEPIDTGPGFGRAALALAVLAVVGTGISTALFYRLIQARGPLHAGLVTYIIPVGGVLVGAWLNHEPLSLVQIGALTWILFSVGFTQRMGAD